MTELLVQNSLFDETARDGKEFQKIFGGETTGISNLNDVKYDWVAPTYRLMVGNHWVPEKVDLSKDKVTIKNLTQEEDEAVQNTLSFLIFLDSFQTNNLPNIKDYITTPAVGNLIAIQLFQEVIHSQSYQVILDALYPFMTREAIYNKWRTNPVLKARNKFIAKIADDFKAAPTKQNLKRVLIANFILEGIYFYQGFNFFYQLASRQKLVQTAKMIKYIENDEVTHLGLFGNIIREEMDPTGADEQLIREMVREAVEHEITWCKDVYGNKILGISEQSSEQFVKWLGNDRLARLHLDPEYPDVTNPYKHLDGAKRENFFETTVTEYSKSDTVGGWDEF